MPLTSGPRAQSPEPSPLTAEASKRISQALPEGRKDTLSCTRWARYGGSAPPQLDLIINMAILLQADGETGELFRNGRWGDVMERAN